MLVWPVARALGNAWENVKKHFPRSRRKELREHQRRCEVLRQQLEWVQAHYDSRYLRQELKTIELAKQLVHPRYHYLYDEVLKEYKEQD